ncbi:MAG: Rieske (2Fe-2S) protein [Acidimicrobiia bacterium]
MSVWTDVADVSELARVEALTARAGGTEVAVFNVGGELLACEAACPHRGGPLTEGTVRSGVLTCPRHWWRFDLRSGRRLGDPETRLTCYPVRVAGDRVEVLVPSDRPTSSLRERLLAAGREWTMAQGGLER